MPKNPERAVISREVSTFLARVRRAPTSLAIARVVWDASGLLCVTRGERPVVTVAGDVLPGAKHREVPISPQIAEEVAKHLERFDIRARCKLVAWYA